jgi:hypothetical protein
LRGLRGLCQKTTNKFFETGSITTIAANWVLGNDPGFGIAITKLKIAEIAIVEAAALQMEYGRATLEEGRPYTPTEARASAVGRWTSAAGSRNRLKHQLVGRCSYSTF